MNLSIKEYKELIRDAENKGFSKGANGIEAMEAQLHNLRQSYNKQIKHNEVVVATNRTLLLELTEAKGRIAELEKFNEEWEDECEKLKKENMEYKSIVEGEGNKSALPAIIGATDKLNFAIVKWFMENPQKLDWDNEKDHISLHYDYESCNLYNQLHQVYNFLGCLYFIDAEMSKKFIEDIGEDNLKAYFESMRGGK